MYCTVEDCKNSKQYNLYCSTHYKRLKKTGNARTPSRKEQAYIPGIRNDLIPGYNSWKSMIFRCTASEQPEYKFYGGRCITVCQRWTGLLGFRNFMVDMGQKPTSQHSIDRINPYGNYEPANCEWATKRQQVVNKRKKKYVSFQRHGDSTTVQVWNHRRLLYWKECRNITVIVGVVCTADCRWLTPGMKRNNRLLVMPYMATKDD